MLQPFSLCCTGLLSLESKSRFHSSKVVLLWCFSPGSSLKPAITEGEGRGKGSACWHMQISTQPPAKLVWYLLGQNFPFTSYLEQSHSFFRPPVTLFHGWQLFRPSVRTSSLVATETWDLSLLISGVPRLAEHLRGTNLDLSYFLSSKPRPHCAKWVGWFSYLWIWGREGMKHREGRAKGSRIREALDRGILKAPSDKDSHSILSTTTSSFASWFSFLSALIPTHRSDKLRFLCSCLQAARENHSTMLMGSNVWLPVMISLQCPLVIFIIIPRPWSFSFSCYGHLACFQF